MFNSYVLKGASGTPGRLREKHFFYLGNVGNINDRSNSQIIVTVLLLKM